ncbi:MAG: hypothetical protein SGI90_01955 [Candidatus Eisenbacteria bacterium]|nr:hypothetical protein [Candidatus Eisenbacteria bacterium]
MNPQEQHIPVIDLMAPPALQKPVEKLLKSPILSDERKTLDALTAEESPRRRMSVLSESFRNFETREMAQVLRAGGRLALEHQAAGLRLLFTFLEVKRPGVEVLRQLNALASLERVSLRILLGTWKEGDSTGADAVHPINEMFGEASRCGVIEVGGGKMPRDPDILRASNRQMKSWFRGVAKTLERGEPIQDSEMHFLTQLCMLEINLMERRVSHLASRVDPYDGRSISRLMPILSFYDQDIEHLKNVVARLSTYKPFYDRLLTMEHVLSASEMDKLQKHLLKEVFGHAVARIITAVRENPMLDRELAFLTSAVYQVALLRHEAMPDEPTPDILSILFGILDTVRDEPRLHVVIEPELAKSLFPVIKDWGFVHLLPDIFVLTYREEWAGNFVLPDGTPSLPERAGARPEAPTTVRQLIQRQLGNDAFLVGILENSRITGMPGIVPMIAMQTRSVRVLDKILTSRSLLTGPANKEVPRLILTNPTRVPVQSLKSIINVRYISRVDLDRLAKPTSDVRPDVRGEIVSYMRLLRST